MPNTGLPGPRQARARPAPGPHQARARPAPGPHQAHARPAPGSWKSDFGVERGRISDFGGDGFRVIRGGPGRSRARDLFRNGFETSI